MDKFYKKYIKPHQDIIAYIFWGVVTTAVNLITYHLCFNIIGIEYYTSSIIAWVAAVITTYLTNRKWVFHSKAKSAKEITTEIFRFTASRAATLVMEMAILYLGKDVLGIAEDPTKYIATILVIILNYILSKFFVFQTSDSTASSLKDKGPYRPNNPHPKSHHPQS